MPRKITDDCMIFSMSHRSPHHCICQNCQQLLCSEMTQGCKQQELVLRALEAISNTFNILGRSLSLYEFASSRSAHDSEDTPHRVINDACPGQRWVPCKSTTVSALAFRSMQE